MYVCIIRLFTPKQAALFFYISNFYISYVMILCYHPAVRCEPVQGSGEMEALVTQNLLNAPP